MVNSIWSKRVNHIRAKGGKFCLAKRVKVEWLFQKVPDWDNLSARLSNVNSWCAACTKRDTWDRDTPPLPS